MSETALGCFSQVWRRPQPPQDFPPLSLFLAPETTPAVSDIALGSALVDLGALATLGELSGWYNVINAG